MQRPADIQAVLFDFDGTLSDTERLSNELNRDAFAHFGIDVTDEDLFSLVGTDGVDSVPAVCAKYGRPELTLRDFIALRPDPSVVYRTMDIDLMPGARELIEDLRARGVKTAIASNTVGHCVVYALDRLGLCGLFDAIVTGDMVVRKKPAPDLFELACTFLGVEADHAVVVDDSPSGIRAARAAGIYAVAFTGASVPQDVSAADEIIDTYVGFEI